MIATITSNCILTCIIEVQVKCLFAGPDVPTTVGVHPLVLGHAGPPLVHRVPYDVGQTAGVVLRQLCRPRQLVIVDLYLVEIL